MPPEREPALVDRPEAVPMSPTKEAIAKYFHAHDSNMRSLLSGIVLAAYDQYVTVPGPDRLIKATFRPYVAKAIDAAITDIVIA